MMSSSILLSVIIPTRNRATHLAITLDSLAKQNAVPFDWEVVVVDNGSTDDTEGAIRGKARELPLNIRYVIEPRPGLHFGRHRGAGEAEGIYLAFLDDDVIAAPDWIRGVKLLARDQADAVAGRVLPGWESAPPKWLFKMATCLNNLSLLDEGNSVKTIEPVRAVGCNLFVGKETLYKLGGFHPDGLPKELLRYRGDGETGLMLKFTLRGLRCLYSPEALVWHCIDTSRITAEYQISRAYNQGISRSFTEIRTAHGLYSNEGPNNEASKHQSPEMSIPERVLRSGQRRVRTLRNEFFYKLYGKLLNRIENANRAGWEFHQKEVQKDPALLAYVLQETYFD